MWRKLRVLTEDYWCEVFTSKLQNAMKSFPRMANISSRSKLLIKLVNIFNESIIISFAWYLFCLMCANPQKMLRVLLKSRMIMKFIDRPSCFLPHFDCCVCVNSMLTLTLETNENGMCMTWQDGIHSIVTVTWTLRHRIVFVQNV